MDITNTGNFAIVNPFRYRGYYYDTESGLYYLRSRYYDYLQSRYYDPTTGRFVNADSFEYLGASGDIIGYNLFAYCENNPVKMFDSKGTIAITITFGLLFKVFTGIVVTVAAFQVINGIIHLMSKGGKQRISDSGLRDFTDSQLDSLYKSPGTSKSEKERIKKEQKARKTRNRRKRYGIY